ncbi:MAG: helix-turn-helix transcriptional regulator [Patescibacteria group bacterium]
MNTSNTLKANKISKELLKGSLEILVLSIVKAVPLYGYLIAKELKGQSHEVFNLGEGTLYPLLHKLEDAGWLESWWKEAEGRRRKYYALTPKGRKFLATKAAEWQTFSQAVKRVI